MEKRKIASIEQLRGLAALGVVLCHVAGQFYGIDRYSEGPAKLLGWAGQVGVALFFVISGFCIRLPLARARAEDSSARLDVKDYLAHRALRILPPYWLAIALSIGVAQVAATGLIGGAHGPFDVLIHTVGLQTLSPGSLNSINGVFWTISLEIQFYLAYLVLANRAARAQTALLLLVLGLAIYGAASVVFPHPSPWRIVGQVFVLATFWQWYLGVLLADLYVRVGQRTGPAILVWGARGAATALCFGLGLGDPVFAGAHLTYWALPIAAALVVASCLVRPARARSGALGDAVGLTGKVSYSLYLLHPVAIAIAALAVRQASLPPWIGAALAVGAALLAAYAGYRLIERPLLGAKRRLGSTVAASRAVLAPGE
jgi:peptidoglycan/LPS O-acetylase OafA/YrhL